MDTLELFSASRDHIRVPDQPPVAGQVAILGSNLEVDLALGILDLDDLAAHGRMLTVGR